MEWLWPQAPGTPSSRSGTNHPQPQMGQGREQHPCPCPHYRPGALGLGTHAKPPSLGYRTLGPAPIPRFGSSQGAPTVEIKVGMEWGKQKGRKALTLCCPGAGASPLWRARGRRWKLQGLAFLNWFYFNFYYIFSFSIKEPLPTLYAVSLLAIPSPTKQAGSGYEAPPRCRQRVFYTHLRPAVPRDNPTQLCPCPLP